MNLIIMNKLELWTNPDVIRVCVGGGGTSSKYMVEMQPRGVHDGFTQKYVGNWSSWK